MNEDSTRQEKLIEKVEKKFDNKALEHIAQHTTIKQVELSTIFVNIENSFTNVTPLFVKLCDVTRFTNEIKEELNKIDENMQANA